MMLKGMIGFSMLAICVVFFSAGLSVLFKTPGLAAVVGTIALGFLAAWLLAVVIRGLFGSRFDLPESYTVN